MSKQRFNYHLAIERTFQGLGIMLSFDNPYAERDYICFHLKILWLNFWFILYKKD